ncbi:MAG TPA: hypothetical protein VJY35_03370 [Candidatus Eisenbacteria bacterium]|nr:hypothetical protein [Candidatus Eisenbacteria bacterium]
MRRLVILVMAATLLAGCAPQAIRRTFDVGEHRVSMAARPEWRFVEQGRRLLMRHGQVGLALEDLGPRGRAGIRAEIERARTLWRGGQDREARTRMTMIPVPEVLFAAPEQRRAFWETWHEVSGAPEGLDPTLVEGRFDRLLDAVETLRERPADELVDDALLEMGEDERRSVASRSRRTVGGRGVIVVVTWNRLSHDGARRFAFVDHDGRILVLRTGAVAGTLAGAADDRAFESVLESLRIEPAAAQSVAGGRRSIT